MSHNVNASLIMKIASVILDLTMRATILERVAGLPHGAWSRNIRKFLQEAPATFPEADPRWFSNKGEEMYSSLFTGAMKVIQNRQKAEDVNQEFYAQDWAKAIAKSVADDINDGPTGWARTKGILFNRGKQWGLDLVKSAPERASTRKVDIGERKEDGPATYNPSTEFGGDFSELDRMKALLGLMDHDPRVRGLVLSELKHRALPSELAAYQAKKEHPDASYSDLAKILGYRNVFKGGVDTGYADGGGVRKLLEKVTHYIADISQNSVPVQNAVELYLQSKGSSATQHMASMHTGSVSRIAEKQDGSILFSLMKEFGLLH